MRLHHLAATRVDHFHGHAAVPAGGGVVFRKQMMADECLVGNAHPTSYGLTNNPSYRWLVTMLPTRAAPGKLASK